MTKEPQIVEEIQHKVEEVTVSRPEKRRRINLLELYLVGITIISFVLAGIARVVPYFSADLAITRAIQQVDNPLFSGLMLAVSMIGYFPQEVFVIAPIVTLLYAAKLRWEAVVALLNVITIHIVTGILKTIVHRPRPTDDLVDVFEKIGEFSFPSGHVMFYTSFFGFMFFLTYVFLKRRRLRTILLTIFASLILLVAPSRIYLGQHWASDTLGAYMFGTIWLIITVYFYDWGRKKAFLKDNKRS